MGGGGLARLQLLEGVAGNGKEGGLQLLHKK